jgi:lactate permease
MEVVNGKPVPSPYFKQVNINLIIATTLAKALAYAFPLAVPFIGLIGAFVGGSATASNVLFAKIRWDVTNATIGPEAFMWVYADHCCGRGNSRDIRDHAIHYSRSCYTLFLNFRD